VAGKRSASPDGYIAYIDIGDGLHLGVTLAFLMMRRTISCCEKFSASGTVSGTTKESLFRR